ncbi:MAG: hypothetical protein EP343_07675 [Deltaproteobacteria bacterium]|nr:MAG: hypothetical protein EP343_07675 [Deltaproteobacteria bacterium]
MLKQLLHTHSWVFTVTFLFSSSYLLAKTASNTVSLMLPTKRTYTIKQKGQLQNNGYQRNVRASYAVLAHVNLIDKDQKPVQAPTTPKTVKKSKKDEKPKAYKPCDPKAAYRRTKLPLQLKGTSVASDPSYSVAVLYDAKKRQLFAVRPGDEYQGIVICDIEEGPLVEKMVKRTVYKEGPNGKSIPMTVKEKTVIKKPSYVKLDRGGGRFEYVEQYAPPGRGGGNYRSSLYKKYRKLRSTKLNLSQIKKTGNKQYSLPRNLLDSMTKRLDVLASQAAIVPFFKKGKPAGFRVYHIKRGSLYQKLGIKNGDVIRRINGYEFTSPQKALEAYSNLMSAKNLSVEVMRKGKLQNYSYEVKDQ